MLLLFWVLYGGMRLSYVYGRPFPDLKFSDLIGKLFLATLAVNNPNRRSAYVSDGANSIQEGIMYDL